MPFNPNALVFKEATYKGILAYTREDFVRVIEQMSTGEFVLAASHYCAYKFRELTFLCRRNHASFDDYEEDTFGGLG